MTQSRDCLDALGPQLRGVDRAAVAVDGLREAQPQVPDPAHIVRFYMLRGGEDEYVRGFRERDIEVAGDRTVGGAIDSRLV